MDGSNRETSAPLSLAGEAMERELALVERMMDELVTGPSDDVAGPMAQEHLGTGGKRLRARLALAATRALDGPPALGRVWATACEVLHNATLVHDDLQDGDRLRRGRPTVWAQHGVEQAVNVGDLLFALPAVAVSRSGASPDLQADLLAAIAHYTAMVVRGQAMELALTRAQRTEPAAYLAAVTGKPSALFELPAYGAARIGGRARAHVVELAAACRPLGVLFQLQDDVLDLYGDKGRDEVGSDLREGKISALVVEHVRLHGEEGPRLLYLLATPRDETPQADIEHFIARFREGGALAAVMRRIEQYANSVRTHPALRREQRLGAVIEELIARALEPIAHLVGSSER